jgi:AAA domain
MTALLEPAFDAAWLMRQQFPPTKYVVPGIIPEGLTLLVAAPKIGKSWMVLGLGVELSTGGKAFGAIPVGEPRPVLYLALEDGKRRLQERLGKLNPAEVSERLQFMTDLAPGQVIATIREFMTEHAGLDPVVILDTLGKVMPPAGNGNQYGHDYSVLSALKATSDAVPGSSLVIVHHTRKMDAGDFLDAVSGTQGIAGAADTVLVLRRERQEPRATLQVTSRDAAEGEYSLILTESCAWELDGGSLTEASAAAQTAKATAGLGDRMTDVIEAVGRFPEGVTPRELKAELPDVSNINEYLRRAHEAGRIQKLTRGLYAPVICVTSVTLPIPDELSKSHKSHNSHPLQGALGVSASGPTTNALLRRLAVCKRDRD